MNIFARQKKRSGFSVVEVLTSIIVAAIGVAGVMVMIPFGVGQAEQGLDQQIASNLARNAAEELEIRSFGDPITWQTLPAGTGTGRDYVLDPMGTSARLMAGDTPGFFPFVAQQLEAAVIASSQQAYLQDGIASSDKTILILRRNLASAAAATPIQRMELARSLFRWGDDLTFSTELLANGAPAQEMLPPQQIFDVVPGAPPTPVRRQAEGEMSFLVVSSPENLLPNPSAYPTAPANPDIGVFDRVESFRNQVLSYRRRLPPLSASNTFDRIYSAFPPSTDPLVGSFLPNDRIAYGGGDLFLTDETDANLKASNNASGQRPEIRRGDWIELVNVMFDVKVNRFRRQVQFYQVLDAWYDTSVAPFGWRVTLQGPNFDFGIAKTGSTPDSPQLYGTGFGSGFPDYSARVVLAGAQTRTIPSKTYAIHLPDVWAVVERTSSTPALR
jgi:hypothetical protein